MAFEIENGVLKQYTGEKDVTEITIPDGVTSISERAFMSEHCLNLKSVTIPDSVKIISKGAFRICVSLTDINVSKNNKNFCSCDGVLYNKDMTMLIQYPIGKTTAEFIIPDSVKIIRKEAFNCQNLTEITIPESVKSIEYYAIYNCQNIANINVSKKNKKFCSCDGVLYNKNMTMLIKYPEAKKTAEFIIPDGVRSICNNAFEFCPNLTDITIPDSVKNISKKHFFENITPIDKIRFMINHAFAYCTNLTNINVSEKNKKFCSRNGILYNKNMTMLIQYPKTKTTAEFIIPDSVKSIREYAFRMCKNLTSITIPDSITSIEKDSFDFCENIKNIEICKDDVKVSFKPDDCSDLDSEQSELRIFIVSDINGRLKCFSKLRTNYQLPLAFFMTSAYPQESADYLDYLKNNAENAVRYLVDAENIDLMYKFFEYGFVKEDNIDGLISYAIEHTQNGGSSEPQLVLAKYKSDNFSPNSANTFDKLML